MNPIIKRDIEAIIKNLGNEINLFKNKNILFAGGGGFLGYYFSLLFTELSNKNDFNFKITFADNFISSSKKYLFNSSEYENINFLNLDICSPSIVHLKENYDFIIHAAGIASPYYYRKKPLETLDVSITGSKNLLELARLNNSKYVFFSSSEIYGDPFDSFVPINEDYRGNVSTMGPRACYDEGKRVGETLCYIYQNYHNVKTSIIRPFNIYGPGMKKNDYRVMSNFAKNFLDDEPLTVYGSGKQTRTFCYITDGIEGFLRVILFGKNGNSYNIGNDKPEISMYDLAKTFFDCHNVKPNIKIIDYPTTYPEDEPNRRCPDISKAKDHLNFLPKIKLETGIKNYLEWCKQEF